MSIWERLGWCAVVVLGIAVAASLLILFFAIRPVAADCPVHNGERGGNPTSWIVGRRC